jgi:hypothetical protein
VLLIDAVHAAVGPAEVAPGRVQLLDEVDVTEKLAAARLQLLGGFFDVVDPEAEDDAVIEAPRAGR